MLRRTSGDPESMALRKQPMTNTHAVAGLTARARGGRDNATCGRRAPIRAAKGTRRNLAFKLDGPTREIKASAALLDAKQSSADSRNRGVQRRRDASRTARTSARQRQRPTSAPSLSKTFCILSLAWSASSILTRLVASQVYLCQADVKMVLGYAPVTPVGGKATESRVYKRVKHYAANVSFNPAQTSHLFGCQTHSGHFQILGADTLNDLFNGSHRDFS